MELFDYGWADDHDSCCNGNCNHCGVAVVSGVPTVERLNFDDRPDKHNLGGRYPGEEFMRKHGLFLFGAKNTAPFTEVRGLTLKGEKTMMKAIKNFMNKPWTWGTYFKFCGVAMGLWTAIIGAYVAWAKWNEKKALKEMQESNLKEDNI